jgi:hypothetical protein
MRFDILDEYSTLVPFGLAVSKNNRTVQVSTTSVGTFRISAFENLLCSLRSKLSSFRSLDQFKRREAAP